jgi:hypothetical protein
MAKRMATLAASNSWRFLGIGRFQERRKVPPSIATTVRHLRL